ncbi:MAG TPA: AI-2E family transporter, partial [Candidatus Nanoarchaeia archaeon]|nr:AI-2E family transporter [Candidatus Nanoarchaeia archaeon]
MFIALLLILLYLTFRLLQPFLRYIFMGAILTIAIYPLYAWFVNRIKSQKVSSIIVILLILLILVIPSFIIAGVLVKQTIGFISSFNAERLAEANSYVVELLGTQFDMRENFTQLLIGLREFMVKSAVALAGSVAEIVIGLFIMFFIMYYGFVEGNNWVQQLREFIPFTKERKEKLVKEIKNVTT